MNDEDTYRKRLFWYSVGIRNVRETLGDKVNELKESLEKCRGYRELMAKKGLTQLSLTDADLIEISKRMHGNLGIYPHKCIRGNLEIFLKYDYEKK